MSDTLMPASDLAARRRPLFAGETDDYAAARGRLSSPRRSSFGMAWSASLNSDVRCRPGR